jgi:hypothetical protein
VLVGLYEEPERPANAVDYIKRYMGAPAGVDVEALRLEVESLRADNAKLQSTIKDLNAKVTCFLSLFFLCFSRFLFSYAFLCRFKVNNEKREKKVLFLLFLHFQIF